MSEDDQQDLEAGDDQQDLEADPAGTDEDHDDDAGRAGTDEDHDDEDHDEDHDDEADDDDEDPEDGASFDAAYVRRLRRRSAGYRTDLRTTTDALEAARRSLFTERVEAMGLLADSADLPYDPDMLEDHDALEDAARDLVRRKPHYARRAGLRDSGARETPGGRDGGLLDLMRGS